VPVTTPDPVGTFGAVTEVKIVTFDEKFNCLVVALYGKLTVPVFGQFNHPGSELSFNACHDIDPVVNVGA
jgi:hypothetical protein